MTFIVLSPLPRTLCAGVLLVLSTACNREASSNEPCAMVGTWKISSADQLVMDANNTWRWTRPDGELTGTWHQNGADVSITTQSSPNKAAQEAACSAETSGTYLLNWSRACKRVELTTKSDACAPRAKVLNNLVLRRNE